MCQVTIQFRSDCGLMLSVPIETPLLCRSPRIDYILLKEPACLEKVVGFIWTGMQTVGKVLYHRELMVPGPDSNNTTIFCLLIVIVIVTTFKSIMPTQLASGEEQDKMQRLVKGTHVINALETTTLLVKNDVMWLTCFITFARDYNCNFSVLCAREIVATLVTVFIEAKENPAILVRSHVGSEF